ncbi:hypothetical protein BD769DRAFT_901344 [Suillus cothurnatus]|nr:hypothetical protein BD769DRAFT_901344 [Suillus cothurnatus]
MLLEICIGLKVSSSVPGPTILSPNLVSMQYLYALSVIDTCTRHVLNSTSECVDNVRLKRPNVIYGFFPSSQDSLTSISRSTPEPRKIGGIPVNTSFGWRGRYSNQYGSGLNVLNVPPITSLAQLVSTPTPGRQFSLLLSAYRVLFLQNEEQGFHPLMDQYLQSWLHSDQLITLTNRTPH